MPEAIPFEYATWFGLFCLGIGLICGYGLSLASGKPDPQPQRLSIPPRDETDASVPQDLVGVRIV